MYVSSRAPPALISLSRARVPCHHHSWVLQWWWVAICLIVVHVSLLLLMVAMVRMEEEGEHFIGFLARNHMDTVHSDV